MNDTEVPRDVPVADILGEEDINIQMISIMPGIQVETGYSDSGVNSLSQKIIRIALALFLFQTLVAIAITIFNFSVGTVVWYVFNILIYFLIFRVAVICVKSKNAPLCCCKNCCRALDVFSIYLGITGFILFIAIIINVVVAATENIWAILSLVLNLVLFTLNMAELYYSFKLIKMLNTRVQPAPPGADIEV